MITRDMTHERRHAAATAAWTSMYPLQRPLFKLGAVAGLAAGIVTLSPLAAFAVALAFWLVGATWRSGDLPVPTFCLLFQWLFVVSGYFVQLLFGYFPADVALGNLDDAVFLSLLGLAAITLGVRFVALPGNPDALNARDDALARGRSYDPKRLFWLVVALFSINWFYETFPMALLFNAAQAIHSFLIFRYLFFLILLMAVMRQRSGYQYAALAFVFVLLPELTSSMAKFKEVIFMLLVVLLSAWQPWSTDQAQRARNVRIVAMIALVSIATIASGLIWTGGVKSDWRSAIRSGQVKGSPTEKIEQFGDKLNSAIDRFDLGFASQSLASRMSSGVVYFSRVVNNVPALVPHEEGKLTWRALEHIFKPRILFPEKENLGGDSWLVRHYAGLNVAGDESQTSVGLGYMAEFYIDFGVPLMFVPLIALGMLIGYIHRVMLRVAPSHYLAEAALTGLLIQHFIGYESHFTKLLGGLCQSAIIFTLVLVLAGPWLHSLVTRPVHARDERAEPGGLGRSLPR